MTRPPGRRPFQLTSFRTDTPDGRHQPGGRRPFITMQLDKTDSVFYTVGQGGVFQNETKTG